MQYGCHSTATVIFGIYFILTIFYFIKEKGSDSRLKPIQSLRIVGSSTRSLLKGITVNES